MTVIAGMIVVASGVWLLGLGIACLFVPQQAGRFLSGFASNARVHVLEQALRLVAGTGFVLFAPRMAFPWVFEILGWILIGTSVMLLLIPWRWHQRFARQVVPIAIRYIKLYALGALLFGFFVFYSLILPALRTQGG